MRTTLTFDPDVAAMIKRLRAKSSTDFKSLVNDLLRRGLTESAKPKPSKKRYRTPSHDSGKLLIDPHMKVDDMLDLAEGLRRR